MRETTNARRRAQPVPPGGPLADPFGDPGQGHATIAHGPYQESVPIAGLTIGHIRRRFRDRYNIPEGGQGELDGQPVDDDTVIGEGQVLTFMHRANSKGIAAPKVALEGDSVVVESPEGGRTSAPLSAVLPALAPHWFGKCVWGDGVKLVVEMPRGAVVVHQTPPRVHNLQWISPESAMPFGARAAYRDVSISLPYVLVLAVYRVGRGGKLQLSQANECFFLNSSVTSVDDELLYPALLNVSKWDDDKEKHSLAWICTQNLERTFEKIPEPGKRARTAMQELVHHMFDGGFNLSSEHHEGASWFGATAEAQVDERVVDVDRWQEASKEDPMFATEVPWLPTGMTLGQVIRRISGLMKLESRAPVGAGDLARVVMNGSGRKGK